MPTAAILAAFMLAYAEIHYRFRFIPSRYYRRAPEIIADLPTRIQPGKPLPVLILCKDAHLFPVRIEEVCVSIQESTSGRSHFQRYAIQQDLNAQWWHKVLHVSGFAVAPGTHEIDILIYARQNGRRITIRNDNYRLTRRRPFLCHFAAEPLPRGKDYYSGDLHVHSSYTSDQMEFGAPVPATATMAQAMGLDFVAITDHSYDLDDEPENYLHNDPELKKWHAFQREVAHWNRHHANFKVIAGEEVSAGSDALANLHFLVLNDDEFIPGKGDGAEKWLQYEPDLSVAEILSRRKPAAAYFAAHPMMPVPFLQKLFLNRGEWAMADLKQHQLDGLQIWNGHPNGTAEARAAWIRLLLAGGKQRIIAGSDAHGNFNRFRQITLPHVLFSEQNSYHLFGMHRTLIHMEKALSIENLVSALQKGNSAVTTGPFLGVTVIDSLGRSHPCGVTLMQAQAKLAIEAHSTAEFGALSGIRVFRGRIGAEQEELIVDERLPAKSFAYKSRLPISATDAHHCYFRVELDAECANDGPAGAMSNPIWLQTPLAGEETK